MNQYIKAIIVEDIKENHFVIEKLLGEVAPQVKIIGNAYNLTEANKMISDLKPGLVFLDIQFEMEGSTAFDLLSKLSATDQLSFQIIIITAHSEKAYYEEAFNFGATHFLTKPIDKQKLKDAIERLHFENDGNQFTRIVEHMEKSSYDGKNMGQSGKIVIDGMNYSEVLQIDEIIYLEASGRYTDIYVLSHGNKPLCSSENLGEFEKKLNNHSAFFRIHRNLIVNTNFIIRFSKKDRSIFLISPFNKIYASRERFREFIQFLEQ